MCPPDPDADNARHGRSSREEDSFLVQALRNPLTKEEAFGKIMENYGPRLYSHLRRMTGNHENADDALQNTFMKVWMNADKFRGDSAFFTWVFAIAVNEGRDILQRQKRRGISVPAEAAGLRAASAGPDPEGIRSKLSAALLTLPEKQRLVFDLRYFEEMGYAEIAALTGTTEGALKASYFHAVKKIEKYLTAR